jgi:hypothetical protein
MLLIKRTADSVEILEGAESLPEGEPIRLYSAEDLKRMLGMVDVKEAS